VSPGITRNDAAIDKGGEKVIYLRECRLCELNKRQFYFAGKDEIT